MNDSTQEECVVQADEWADVVDMMAVARVVMTVACVCVTLIRIH